MNIKEFSYYVEEHIREFLPEEIRESVSVSVHPQRKTNDTLHYGMMIRRGDETFSPVIYLENAWREHEDGAEMETVLRGLADTYEAHRKDYGVDMPMEYEAVKDRIIYHVFNKEANLGSLRERIYTDVGQGLVKVYAIHQRLEHFGRMGSIGITHGMMRDYGYDMQAICRDAEENTPQIFPAAFIPLDQMLPVEGQNESADGKTLSVLSNAAGYRGAGVLFYPGMQKKIAEHFGRNYYVLPSSVHEVLIMPEGAGVMAEELEQMVRDINREEVSREDFLSNKVLFYDREKEELRTALPDIPDLQKEDRKKAVER